MHTAIIGAGYVGLVTGACLAAKGQTIALVDHDGARIARIAAGECPIHEAGLAALLASDRISAGTDLQQAVAAADIVMICVSTPSNEDGIDLAILAAACRDVGRAMRKGQTIAVKSTVLPGTTGGILREILEHESGLRCGAEFGLAMNPEFLSQGSAVDDFMRPDRIVIGGVDARSIDMVARLYQGFDAPILRVSLENAEMVKYAANALQASLISFANQIAALCEAIPGGDEAQVLAGVHLDRNFTTDAGQAPVLRFLRGGIGFGGSCFPKDLVALQAFARQIGADAPMIDAAIEINRSRPEQVMALLERDIGPIAGRRIAVLGLAFKPGTDDIRESPGLRLAQLLQSAGADILAHDPLPEVRDKCRAACAIAEDLADALNGAEAAIIATAWPEYKGADWATLSPSMANPYLLDGRSLLAEIPLPAELRYRRIGTGAALSESTQRKVANADANSS